METPPPYPTDHPSNKGTGIRPLEGWLICGVGGGVSISCVLLIPFSTLPSCPHLLSLPSFLCRPLPRLHGYVKPVFGMLLEFFHYVGRPPAGRY